MKLIVATFLLALLVATPGSAQAADDLPERPARSATSPWHTGIVATTFWVGEIFNPALPDGSQVCSTYDSQWAFHHTGVNLGTVPNSAPGCGGSIRGGCDGIANAEGTICRTERRTRATGFYPTQGPAPLENPFYLDIPFDDLNDPVGFRTRCQVIPWAGQRGYRGRCGDRNFSYLKNRWVEIVGPNRRTCFGQVEDAGPSHGRLYHDARYVFGDRDARPRQRKFNNAGMDVSPALNGCLGFRSLDGQNDRVSWQFVSRKQVRRGPWLRTVTRSGVS